MIAVRARWRWAAIPVLLVCVTVLAWAVHPGQAAAWIAAVAVAWLAAYRMGCDKIGAILWAMTAGLVSWPLCIVATHGTSEHLLRPGPFRVYLAPVLLLAALLRFLWAGRKTASANGSNAAMVVVTVFTLIIPATVVSMISSVRQDHSDYQETTQMLVGLHRVAADVESFRNVRGTLPKDEAELVAWRGCAMPSWGPYGKIHYQMEDKDGYCLQSGTQHFWGRGWDLFGYVVTSRGPRAAERIHVELF
jgi:hypothetical protein